MFEMLDRFLKAQDDEITCKRNFELSKASPIGIGAPAAYVLYPLTARSFTQLISFMSRERLPFRVFGRMSNILPRDSYYNGVVVRTDMLRHISVDGSLIHAECGASFGAIAARCVQEELAGVEELGGIPGSIGGSIMGNAGAFGREISDVLKSVYVYDTHTDKKYVIDSCSIDFSYRYCSLDSERYLILGADIALSKGTRESIKENLGRYRQKRAATQPVGKKTLGSTFKRYDGRSAGELIDLCGLKGLCIGDAQISPKHAGFIVNNGAARAADVLELMRTAQLEVERKFGISLEREIIVM